MITFFLLTTSIAFIIFSAVVDAQHIKAKQYFEDHGSRFLLRLCFFIAIALHNWQLGLASALLFATTFDQVLNLLLDRETFYLGNTAKWDIFFRNKLWLYKIVKLLTLLGSATLFIKNV